MKLQAMIYAINAHASVNQTYGDGVPYSVHLCMVAEYAYKYRDCIPDDVFEYVLLPACWLHDTIEDCRKTYNDIKDKFGEQVADVVFAVTNEKGKTRRDRANEKYYTGIIQTPFALFVKLCDRLANVSYSKQINSSMLQAYKKENTSFMAYISKSKNIGNYRCMINELNNMLS